MGTAQGRAQGVGVSSAEKGLFTNQASTEVFLFLDQR